MISESLKELWSKKSMSDIIVSTVPADELNLLLDIQLWFVDHVKVCYM